MDALETLRLQLEWGVDEALLDGAVDRFGQTPPARALSRAPSRAVHRPVARASAEAARELAGAADSMEALAAALRAFDPDGLAATATSLVFASAPARAELALIGDVPAADEDRAGVPFSGRAGALLERMLASIGLDRAGILLAHVVPWRPPGGRPVSEAEIAAYAPFLHRQLALGGARRLLLLGAGPTRALIGRDASLPRLRGRWRDVDVPGDAGKLSALPTFGPAQLLERPELKRVAWQDWRLLRRTLDAG